MNSSIKTGLILGVSLIISALIFGSYFYQAQSPGQTITVVGAASRNFEADTVKWTLNIEEDVLGDNLSAGYERLKMVREKIFALLAAKGINPGSVTMKPPQVYKEYDYTEGARIFRRSEEHTSELQSRPHLVCRLLLEKKKRAGGSKAA